MVLKLMGILNTLNVLGPEQFVVYAVENKTDCDSRVL